MTDVKAVCVPPDTLWGPNADLSFPLRPSVITFPLPCRGHRTSHPPAPHPLVSGDGCRRWCQRWQTVSERSHWLPFRWYEPQTRGQFFELSRGKDANSSTDASFKLVKNGKMIPKWTLCNPKRFDPWWFYVFLTVLGYRQWLKLWKLSQLQRQLQNLYLSSASELSIKLSWQLAIWDVVKVTDSQMLVPKLRPPSFDPLLNMWRHIKA